MGVYLEIKWLFQLVFSLWFNLFSPALPYFCLISAINIDHVNVKGYTAWSLLDNIERGYTEPFGLYHVNVSDPARPRTPKASADYYRSVIEDNGFPDKTVRVSPTSYKDQFLYGDFPADFNWSVSEVLQSEFDYSHSCKWFMLTNNALTGKIITFFTSP